jgi:hypothetical protein
MTHNIIKTENYLLVVDDSEIKQNDFFYGVADGSIKPFIEIADENIVEIVTWQLNVVGKSPNKKIIFHLPLNNSPVLEGVPLLPPLKDEVVELAQAYVINTPDNDPLRVFAFIEGYNKAKEKYNADLGELLSDFYFFATNGEVCDHEVINEFIQSLQQPKMPAKRPVGFECEIFEAKDLKSVDEDWRKLGKHKTTTNSQGQTVLVGKYIY